MGNIYLPDKIAVLFTLSGNYGASVAVLHKLNVRLAEKHQIILIEKGYRLRQCGISLIFLIPQKIYEKLCDKAVRILEKHLVG